MKKILSLLFAINLFAAPLTVEQKAQINELVVVAHAQSWELWYSLHEEYNLTAYSQNFEMMSASDPISAILLYLICFHEAVRTCQMPKVFNLEDNLGEKVNRLLVELLKTLNDIEVIANVNSDIPDMKKKLNNFHMCMHNIVPTITLYIAHKQGNGKMIGNDMHIEFKLGTNFNEHYKEFMQEYIGKLKICSIIYLSKLCEKIDAPLPSISVHNANGQISTR